MLQAKYYILHISCEGSQILNRINCIPSKKSAWIIHSSDPLGDTTRNKSTATENAQKNSGSGRKV
jgi:hypothetical protein